MALALALLAALAWGAADFLGGLASRRTPTFAVVGWSQAAGLLVVVPAAAFFPHAATAADLGWGALAGLAGALAIGFLYRGLAIGTMGIVSPVTAILAAALPVLYGVAGGERPALLTWLGILAALAAVACVSATPGSGPAARGAFGLPAGLPHAIGAGAGFAVFLIAIAQTHPAAGLLPLLAARGASLAAFALAAAVRGPHLLRIGRAAVTTIVAAGVLDMAANALYLLASRHGLLAMVAVVSSALYPAATIGLAAIVLGERLVRLQWAGVALALGGIAALAAG